MTLDSTKRASLAADEPAYTSSKKDPSKLAKDDKTLDDLIFSLKEKLIRSRLDQTKPSNNSKKRERHILSEKYALSRDHHRLRHRSREQWRGNGSSRDRSRDDAASTRKLTHNGHATSKNISGNLKLNSLNTVQGVDTSCKTEPEEKIKVVELVKIETGNVKPEDRLAKTPALSRSGSGGFSELSPSAKVSNLKKDTSFDTVDKVQLPFVRALNLQTVDEKKLDEKLFPVSGRGFNRQQKDVFAVESKMKRRKFQKSLCSDTPEYYEKRKGNTDGSHQTDPSSVVVVDRESALIRLTADRLRLDRFRGHLGQYASAVLDAQSRLRGMIRDLTSVSPVSSSPPNGCHGNGEDASGCRGDRDHDDRDTNGRHGNGELINNNVGTTNDGWSYSNGCQGNAEVEETICIHGNGEDRSDTANHHGDAEERKGGCHGDDVGGGASRASAADRLRTMDETEMLGADTEAGMNESESSHLSTFPDLPAPSLLPQTQNPESLEDHERPPILSRIEDLHPATHWSDIDHVTANHDHVTSDLDHVKSNLYQVASNFNHVTTRLDHVTTSTDHMTVDYLATVKRDVCSRADEEVEDLCTGGARIDAGILPLEANSSGPGLEDQLEERTDRYSKEQLGNCCPYQLSEERLPIDLSPDSKGKRESRSCSGSKEQVEDKLELISKEQIVNHWNLVSIEDPMDCTNAISKEELVNNSSLISQEQPVKHSNVTSNEQIVRNSNLSSNDQFLNQFGAISNDRIVSSSSFLKQTYDGHLNLVSKKQPVSRSCSVSEDDLANRTELEQSPTWSSFGSIPRPEASKCPELITHGHVSTAHPPARHEKIPPLPPSTSIGALEKEERCGDRMGPGAKLSPESIRERYVKAVLSFQQLTNLLSLRRRSKSVVDAKLERLRVDLYRLKLSYIMGKSKISEKRKVNVLGTDCGNVCTEGRISLVNEVQLERESAGPGSSKVVLDGTSEERRRFDVSSRQAGVTPPGSSALPGGSKPSSVGGGDRHPPERVDLTVESTSRLEPNSNEATTNDGARPSSPGTSYSVVVDLSTKVIGKPEVPGCQNRTPDTDTVEFVYQEPAVNGPKTGIHIDDRGGNDRRQLEQGKGGSVEGFSSTDYGKDRSSDARDGCSVRVLSQTLEDNGQLSLRQRKRRLLQATLQTEKSSDSNESPHPPRNTEILGAPRSQAEKETASIQRFHDQIGIRRPDFQVFTTPSQTYPSRRCLPTSVNSNLNTAVVVASADRREVGSNVISARTAQVSTESVNEPARKRKMLSRESGNLLFQPESSYQHYGNTFQNNEPYYTSVSGFHLNNTNPPYKANVPTAIQPYGFNSADGQVSITRVANLSQPQLASEFHHQTTAPRQPSYAEPSNNPFQEFSNIGSLDHRLLQPPIAVSLWNTVDPCSRGPVNYHHSGSYISPSGYVLPNYTLPNDPRDLNYMSQSGFDVCTLDRERQRLLGMPPEPLFFTGVRTQPEERDLVFSLGDNGQLLSSAGAGMVPNGLSGFYNPPSGTYYRNSLFDSDLYIGNTMNRYKLTQR